MNSYTFAHKCCRRPSCTLSFILTVLRVFKPWPNGLASRRKFIKPELAYGLAMGGQTDSQVGSQVAKSCKLHAIHNWLEINLCRLGLGGQTVKNWRRLGDEARPKSTQLSTQVGGQTKRKLNWCKSKTCVDLRRLASPCGQGFRQSLVISRLFHVEYVA